MDWINNFINSFGANESYFYRDQADVYKDIQNGESQPTSADGDYNGGGAGKMEERHNQTGRNEETGEKYKVEVKNFDLSQKNKKDKKEKEWMDRETMVTFTSLDDESKYVQSSIDTLCGGRYKALKGLSAKKIAAILIGEHKNIFGYAEASIANYSSAIDAVQALRLAKTASTNNVINHADYEKIQSKLSGTFLKEFDRLLADTSIKVAYPMPAPIQKVADEKEEKGPSFVDYTFDYIKDFKEYKIADTEGLRKRAVSVLSHLEGEDRTNLINRFKTDRVLKNII